MTGVYVIVIELKNSRGIRFGRNFRNLFESGYYAYVGSALSSLEQRLARHLRPEKKRHWHIDYLLEPGEVRTVIYAATSDRRECTIARNLAQSLPSVKNFGSSDCGCPSHLFFSRDTERLQEIINTSFRLAGLTSTRRA